MSEGKGNYLLLLRPQVKIVIILPVSYIVSSYWCWLTLKVWSVVIKFLTYCLLSLVLFWVQNYTVICRYFHPEAVYVWDNCSYNFMPWSQKYHFLHMQWPLVRVRFRHGHILMWIRLLRCLLDWFPLDLCLCFRCDVSWEHGLSTDLCRNRLQIHISADDILNVNITDTLVDLYKMVKENWTQDYYNLTPRERLVSYQILYYMNWTHYH
jgi:hypothetical protein